jgi:hypothetical protein
LVTPAHAGARQHLQPIVATIVVVLAQQITSGDAQSTSTPCSA